MRAPASIAPLDLARLERLAGSGLRLTHLDRVAFPVIAGRDALLKAHVVDYYAAIAPAILPHLEDRPLAFRRYHEGVSGSYFYTKDWDRESVPASVRLVPVGSESRNEVKRYAVVADEAGVAWIGETAAIEAHAWLSRVRDASACADPQGLVSRACGLDRPDVLAFDLDPYVRAKATRTKGTEAGGEPGLAPEDWEKAVEAALGLRALLADLGLEAFAKTSGKRGLHVVVPIEPERSFGVVRGVARRIAPHLARRDPERYTISYDLESRKGRVFLDYNQNARGKTLATAWSLRFALAVTNSVTRIAREDSGSAASASSSVTTTRESFDTSTPRTMSSFASVLSHARHFFSCRIGAWSSLWSWRNETAVLRVVATRLTGTFTRPNESAPFHTVCIERSPIPQGPFLPRLAFPLAADESIPRGRAHRSTPATSNSHPEPPPAPHRTSRACTSLPSAHESAPSRNPRSNSHPAAASPREHERQPSMRTLRATPAVGTETRSRPTPSTGANSTACASVAGAALSARARPSA